MRMCVVICGYVQLCMDTRMPVCVCVYGCTRVCICIYASACEKTLVCWYVHMFVCVVCVRLCLCLSTCTAYVMYNVGCPNHPVKFIKA